MHVHRNPSTRSPESAPAAAPSPEEGPLVGSSCSTVTPGTNRACCQTKIAENVTDAWCEATYPGLFRPPALAPPSPVPSPPTPVPVPSPTPDPPLVGGSCSTVTPGDNEACCERKVAENELDTWCEENFPQVCASSWNGHAARA